jgi:hypothetical protein
MCTAFCLLCLMQAAIPFNTAADDVQAFRGTLNLKGEAFGTGSQDLINRGMISGHGVLRSRKLTNMSSMRLTGGPITVNSIIENVGNIDILHDRAVFNRDVINRGRMKITDTVVTFEGSYTENGAYISDPSDNYFNDLIIGTSGYLVGGAGDNFYVRGDFISSSTMNTNWQTVESYLEFETGADTLHDFHITGIDSGITMAGYTDNFAWGTLNVASGNSVTLVDGNVVPGGALYVKEILGAQITGSTVNNISGSDSINIYYLPSMSGNAYLGGLTYSLTGTGQLIPIVSAIPTISEWGMVIMALLFITAGMMVIRRRQEH